MQVFGELEFEQGNTFQSGAGFHHGLLCFAPDTQISPQNHAAKGVYCLE